jgi:Mn-containing catalase
MSHLGGMVFAHGIRGKSPGLDETWKYIEDPITCITETDGLLEEEIEGTKRTEKTVALHNEKLS